MTSARPPAQTGWFALRLGSMEREKPEQTETEVRAGRVTQGWHSLRRER
jgi:hypothetical protein